MKEVSVSRVEDYSVTSIQEALRNLFSLLGYDRHNPLGGLIKPGMNVFIKPNWVASRWRESCETKGDLYSIITHPVVIEAVTDFVAIALDGKGQIFIGDNPSIDADFDELMDVTGLRRLEKKYRVPCKILDLRPLVCRDLNDYGKKDRMLPKMGDPNGEYTINLGKESLFYDIDPSLFRGVFDEREETIASHTRETQLYTFGRSLYDADVYISLPKLKTHQKVGATLNLKGLVGAVTQKNQLVHWKISSPETGGDEYPNRQAMERAKFDKVKHRGAWPGNDTIWRMVVDLYHCMEKRPRKTFSIVDGVLSGEGNGPFCVKDKWTNVLIAGEDLLSVDLASVRLMGFDPIKIRYLKYFLDKDPTLLKFINIKGMDLESDCFFASKLPYLNFCPAEGWEDLRVDKGA